MKNLLEKRVKLVLFVFFLCSYSNIFVTSPSPDNLHTLFEFIFKGFDALQYQVRRAKHFTIFTVSPEVAHSIISQENQFLYM